MVGPRPSPNRAVMSRRGNGVVGRTGGWTDRQSGRLVGCHPAAATELGRSLFQLQEVPSP